MALTVAILLGSAVFAPAAGIGAQAGASAGTVTLSLTPRSIVADQAVELTAVVRAVDPEAEPSGAIAFFRGSTPLIGCGAIRVDPDARQGTYRCRAVFGVQVAQLQAVFVPARGSQVASASSPVLRLAVPRAPTTLTVQAPPDVVTGVATPLTATLALAPHDSGVIPARGTIQLFDAGAPIAGCAAAVPSHLRLTCTVSYPRGGAHQITARYSGDDQYLPARSAAVAQTAVAVAGQITARLGWRFAFTPRATRVLGLTASEVPVGATLTVTCWGGGCPLHSDTQTATTTGPIALGGSFAAAKLAPGASVTVAITRSHYVGKSYAFTIRRAAQPSVVIACLTPGSPRPGSGCALPPAT